MYTYSTYSTYYLPTYLDTYIHADIIYVLTNSLIINIYIYISSDKLKTSKIQAILSGIINGSDVKHEVI